MAQKRMPIEKNEILGLLEANPHLSAQQCAHMVGVKPTKLSSERKRDPDFDAKVRALRPTGWALERRRTPEVKRKLEIFLNLYAKTLKIVQSCEAAGIEPATVYNLSNPNHATYDPEFAAKYEDAACQLISKAEDNIAERVRDKEDFRVDLAVLAARDRRRWNPKFEQQQQQQPQRNVTVNIQELHMELAAGMSRAIGPGNVIEAKVAQG